MQHVGILGRSAVSVPREARVHVPTRARTLAPIALVFLFWVFCNPFYAIDCSGLIYTARAIADLDPLGVGRDVMFRLDGQSRFTIFTVVMRAIAARIGIADAATLVAAAAVAVGFVGMAVLVWSATSGRARYLALAFAASLPAYYGGYNLFSYGEVSATPRPFAEAIVLAGLAALLQRRRLLAAALMVAATLVHPIMASCGFAVLWLWLVCDDRRWLLAVPALCLAVAAAIALKVAPLDHVLDLADPAWRAILIERNPHLFPSLWPEGWMGRGGARVATLLIAANLVPRPTRRLFLCALVAGLAGLLAAAVLNERLAPELLLQLQTWRMMWLVFALATVAAAVCAVELWRRDGFSRVALGFLALAWVTADMDAIAGLFATIAVGIHYGIAPDAYPRARLVLRGLALACLAVVVATLARGQITDYAVVAGAPAGLALEARRSLALSFDYTPLAFVAAVWTVTGVRAPGRLAETLLALVGIFAIVASWDQRSLAARVLASGAGADDLRAIVAAKPGEIYWVDGGQEAWSWLGRPQWLTAIQGAGVVFSRDLAVVYRDRSRRAIEAGLGNVNVLAPFGSDAAMTEPHLARDKIASFCAEPDAPAWIVAPLFAETAPPVGVGTIEWRAPFDRLERIGTGDAMRWQRLSRYAVIPCKP